jgi:hypothetical protein
MLMPIAARRSSAPLKPNASKNYTVVIATDTVSKAQRYFADVSDKKSQDRGAAIDGQRGGGER